MVLIYRKLPRLMGSVLGAIAAVSFVAAVITVSGDANSAFFYAPLRAWELLIGAILAHGLLPRIHGLMFRNLASAGGLALISWSALRYGGGTAFPGAAALAPCVGAALIIAAGENGSSVVGAMLSLRPVVFLGLISYSIYLWHWPLLVFQRTDKMLFAQSEHTMADKVMFTVLVVAIASASWFFIEQPIRRGRFRPAPRVLIPATASVVAMLAITSIALRISGGFPGRFPLDAQHVGAYTNYDRGPSTRDGICYMQPTAEFADFRSDPCLAAASRAQVDSAGGRQSSSTSVSGACTGFPGRRHSAGERLVVPSVDY